jgi:hypothetical protein
VTRRIGWNLIAVQRACWQYRDRLALCGDVWEVDPHHCVGSSLEAERSHHSQNAAHRGVGLHTVLVVNRAGCHV